MILDLDEGVFSQQASVVVILGMQPGQKGTQTLDSQRVLVLALTVISRVFGEVKVSISPAKPGVETQPQLKGHHCRSDPFL